MLGPREPHALPGAPVCHRPPTADPPSHLQVLTLLLEVDAHLGYR